MAIEIVKSSGEKAQFSMGKLRKSLKHSGAGEHLVEEIVAKVQDELFPGISTREIYNRAYALLKKQRSVYASKYKLKKAIYELGPTGFPFERFIAALLKYSGYQVKVGQIVEGICVNHEIDVLAEKKGTTAIVECKFHGEEGRNCNVQIPLYIHSRYNDIKANWDTKAGKLDVGWVVTNTRFTNDAIRYGGCAGLYLLSWDYPQKDGIKDRVDRLKLYPITVSTILSNREKQFLLSRDVVLCRQLFDTEFLLDHLGVGPGRKNKIMEEIRQLCLS